MAKREKMEVPARDVHVNREAWQMGDEYKALKKRTRIDKDAIDTEMVEHPELLRKVGAQHALSISDRDAQKEYLKRIEGRIRARVRATLDGKPTQDDVARAVEADPEWQKERDEYLRHCFEVEMWFGLVEVFKSRGFAIHGYSNYLVGVSGAQANTSYKSPEPRNIREEMRRRG